MTVVAVGKTAFLAGALRADSASKGWIFLSHDEALRDTSWAKNAATVVNFAFSPALRTGAYDAGEDVDSRLAAIVAGAQAKYIMLSTRAVYGISAGDSGLKEGQAENPATPYGSNKLAIENALREKLGDRLTVLRLGNIFGHEYKNGHGRGTFFGQSLAGLAERKTIEFDMNPDQPRDFLASWRFAAALALIAAKPQAGLFNLGAGFGTPCKKIAEWLIEGYGEGRLVVNDKDKKDPFWLDMTKTRAAFGLPVVREEDLRQDCLACGKNLRTG
jgi:dTDP-4-dehydrorhamnose reductase/UDP-glucose 4-epimerase